MHDVFCFGHAPGHKTGRLGVYGIGLKRAIFKIGEAFEMDSKTEDKGFHVGLNVKKWAENDRDMSDWRIPIQFTMGSGSTATAGTKIKFTKLREETRMRIRSGELDASLQRSISQAYALLLEKHITVLLNGTTVRPLPVPIGQSQELRAARSTRTLDDVRMQFFASIIAPKSQWKAEYAGWYVLCNGRVVLAADKSALTGWGGLKVKRPRFSWTRIKRESNGQGSGGNGSVEASDASRRIGTTGVRADAAVAGAGVLGPGQRWSASRKRDVVLRLLRGESLDAVSREVGVEIYRLEEWKERARAGLEFGLKDPAGEPAGAVLDAAKRHIGELSMENELLRERARAAERRRPLPMRRSRR